MATVIVRGGAIGFAQEIEAARHRLVADEPGEAGGTDAGPRRATCCSPRSARARR